jgi:hypothetical protein
MLIGGAACLLVALLIFGKGGMELRRIFVGGAGRKGEGRKSREFLILLKEVDGEGSSRQAVSPMLQM